MRADGMATQIHDEEHHIRLCRVIVDAYRIVGRQRLIAELRTYAPKSPVTHEIVSEQRRELEAIRRKYPRAKL